MNKVENILIDEFKNKRKMAFICYLRKNNYFYGWFDDKKSETADSVVISRINLNSHQIEQCNVLLAAKKWNIDYKDFIDV